MIESTGSKVFRAVNGIVLILLAACCMLPFIHIVAVSLSGNSAVSAGMVGLLPIRFTTDSYAFLLQKYQFWASFGVSVQRVVVGCLVNMFFILTIAYPLSKERAQFRHRTIYVWYFFFTALFSGGLIPSYMLVHNLGLFDTLWALVLPGAVNVYNVVLMLNFFRQIPRELEEAALVDGAGHFRTLIRIYIPCSLPAIATLTLFCVVGHWNAWFDGILYCNRVENYPLQSYLQTVIVGMDFSQGNAFMGNYEVLKEMSDRSMRSAQIIIATIPILLVYPFLQKYFVSGIVVGSVKG